MLWLRLGAPGLCRSCRMAPPPFERAVSYGPYQDRMRAAIHALKYDRLHGGGQAAGPDAGRRRLPSLRPKRRPRCWWFPCRCTGQNTLSAASIRRARWRCSALAALAKSHPEWRLTLASNTLMRLRATESQAGLTPRQRRLNVRGAFTVSDPAAVDGEACAGDRRHFHHRRDGARRGQDAARCGSGIGVGGYAGQGADAGAASSDLAACAEHWTIDAKDESITGSLASKRWHAGDLQRASIFSSHDQSSF